MKSTGLLSPVLLCLAASSAEAAVLRRSTATQAIQRWKSAMVEHDDPAEESDLGGGAETGDVEHLEQSIMSVFAKVQNKSGVDGMVETMMKMVTDDMQPKVNEAQRLAQENLDALFAAFSTCGSAKAVSTKTLPDLTTTRGLRSESHKGCREQEGKETDKVDTCQQVLHGLGEGKKAACLAFDNIKGTDPNHEADTCHSSSESYGNWLTRLREWINGLADTYNEADWACGNATQEWQDQKGICDPLLTTRDETKSACDAYQDQLEDTACRLATGWKTSCEAYTLCYTAALQLLESELPNIMKLEKNRKAEWRALKRMECLLDIWKEGDPKEGDVDECKTLSHNTTHLELNYQATPDMVPCETPIDYPCVSAYTNKEYGSLPGSAPAKDCTVCSGMHSGLTPPANFKTRCVHDQSWSYVLDYSDDRSIDDLPADQNSIAAGFSNENAFYIGNEALEELDIEVAEMCALSSTKMFEGGCQQSCITLTENLFGGGGCPTCSGLSSDLKKMIAMLSGQVTSGRILAASAATGAMGGFQGDLSDVHWSCQGDGRTDLEGLHSWGTGWHKQGWGLSLRPEWGAGQLEFGWYSPFCGWSGRIDPDTFTIRVQLKPSKIVVPKFDRSKFGVTNFRERCTHDAGWLYVLDYSDDRSTDDIPANRNVLNAGFDSTNAYYIGNTKLEALDIKEAEMCMLSSSTLHDGKCNWSCKTLIGATPDSQFLCHTCPGLSSQLKIVIAALSGQSTQGHIIENGDVGIASFQGDQSHVQWSCGGYKTINRWGNGFHSAGWGLSMRTEGFSSHTHQSMEVGWYDNHCGWEDEIDVDTFVVRVKT